MIGFDSIYRSVKGGRKKLAVAHPYGADVITALETARKEDIARSILVGDREKIIRSPMPAFTEPSAIRLTSPFGTKLVIT